MGTGNGLIPALSSFCQSAGTKSVPTSMKLLQVSGGA